MNDPVRAEAEARTQRHVGHASQRILSKGHDLVGGRGEEVFCAEFGIEPDLLAKMRGDDGYDAILTFIDRRGIKIDCKVDVKTSRHTGCLLVEASRCEPQKIYVHAGYSDATDKAWLIGWAWGSTLKKIPARRWPRHIVNHALPKAYLRPMDELKAALAVSV